MPLLRAFIQSLPCLQRRKHIWIYQRDWGALSLEGLVGQAERWLRGAIVKFPPISLNATPASSFLADLSSTHASLPTPVRLRCLAASLPTIVNCLWCPHHGFWRIQSSHPTSESTTSASLMHLQRHRLLALQLLFLSSHVVIRLRLGLGLHSWPNSIIIPQSKHRSGW